MNVLVPKTRTKKVLRKCVVMLIFRWLSACIHRWGWVPVVIQCTGNCVPQNRINLNSLSISYPASKCWAGSLRYLTWNSVSSLDLQHLFLLHWETVFPFVGITALHPFSEAIFQNLVQREGSSGDNFYNGVPSLKECVVFYTGLRIHRKDRE